MAGVATSPTAASTEAIRRALATWFHEAARPMPWRDKPTPYRVWLSEVMLQQTRVETVRPYFDRFLDALPDVASLAAAGEQEVLGLWAGLGYYRRCRALQQAARVVMQAHGGQLPSDAETLATLPGVGRYTAGAIASIAFDEPTAAVDGNVMRVLSRVLALEEPIDRGPGQRLLWETAEALVDPTDPSTHNQALIELGALLCRPRTPVCGRCPLEPWCAGAASGEPTRWPRKRPRKAPIPAWAVSGLIHDDAGRLLLARRPAGGLLGGLWELPGSEVDPGSSRRAQLATALTERVGLEAEVGAHLATVEHVFTHRRLTLEVFAIPTWSGRPRLLGGYEELRFLDREELGEVPLSRLSTKVLSAVGYGADG